MPFEFKTLEVQEEKNLLKRWFHSKHIRRTFLYMILGATISIAIGFFSEGMSFKAIPGNEIFHSGIIGAFMGFFITNSPCARGKC